jgi:hypothetical protein
LQRRQSSGLEIERTKGGFFRTQVITAAVSKDNVQCFLIISNVGSMCEEGSNVPGVREISKSSRMFLMFLKEGKASSSSLVVAT